MAETGGTKVGSAWGEIRIDTSGVQSSVGRVNKSLGTMQSSLGGVAAKMSGALATGALALGAALVGVSVAMGGIVASGIKMAMGLEQQMANIQAVMQNTDQQVEALREHILDLGVDPALKVSAMEAAQAIEMLGRNGLNTTEILEGAARSTVLLANATNAQFNTAADIATDVMALFNIEAANMQTAVDGITSVVNNSKFSIEDYQLALAQGGGVAAMTGVQFNDFNAAIAAISPSFKSGSDAGTSFKTMLQRMAAPTDQARQTMQQLGLVTEQGKIAFFDAEGNMRSMAEIAGMLNTALAGLSDQQRAQALTTIFGADALRAAGGLAQFTEEQFLELQAAMGETSAAEAAATRMNTLAGSLEILSGVVETIRIRIGDVFKNDLRTAVEAFTNLLANNADRIVGFFQIVRTVLAGFAAFIRSFINGLSSTFGARFNQLSANADGWGRNIVMSLARGMAQAMVAVVRVLTQIGAVIRHWLKPGSPPLIVPEIDDYGTGTMEAWLEGFSKADFSIFNEIGNTINSYLRSLGDEVPEEDLIPRILGTRSAIAEAIALMRETGTVSEESLNNIFEAAGVTDQALQDYIRTVLQLEQANQAVAAAQESINQINQEYAALLEPLNAELRALRGEQTNRSEEEELAGIQKRLAEERLTDAERQRLLDRQREIEIQRQIRALEEQRDTAVDAAEEELGAAEEAQAQLEEQAAAQQALINAQIENNNLIQQQLALLERLAEVLEDIGGGGGGGGGGGLEDLLGEGGGLGDIVRDLEELGVGAGDMFGEGLSEGLESIPSAFEDAIGQLMADIEDEFAPLTEAGLLLGETWGGVMDALTGKFEGVSGVAGRFRAAMNNVSSWFTLNRPMIEAFIAQTWGKLSQKMAETGQQILTFISGQAVKITEWFNENRPLIENFATLIGTLAAAFVIFSTEARVALLDFWQVIEPILDYLVDEILSLATLIMQVATGDWAGAWETMRAHPARILQAIQETFVAFANWVAGWFGSSWAEVVATWQTNWEMMKSIPGLAWDAIKAAASAKLDAIRADILARLQALFTAMGLDFDEMKARWAKIWDDVKLIANTVWEAINTAVQGHIAIARDNITNGLNNIKAIWDERWASVRAGLMEVWEAISRIVQERIELVRSNISGGMQQIINTILGFIGAFSSAGAAIINGIISGIASMGGALIAAVTGSAQAAIDAIKRLLGISSPSSVAEEEVGEPIPQGIIRALDRSKPMLRAAMQDLVGMMMTPDLPTLMNNARVVSAPVTNSSQQVINDQSKRIMNVAFGNGRDRVGQATDLNTMRAAAGGI